MNIKLTRTTLAVVAAGVLLGGCGGSSGGNGLPKTSSVNPAQQGTLQLAVGTANFGGATGLNVVSTYRQASGTSNTLLNTPALTGPFSGSLGFTASTGVFTDGLAPANDNSNESVPDSYQPYAQPMDGAAAVQFNPIGGPPAFDPNKDGMGLRDGLQPLGSNGLEAPLGIPEGFTFWSAIAPVAGAYTLGVTIPTSTGTTYSQSANATLGSAGTVLPALVAPALTEDGSGGGTITLPAGDFAGGITEVYVNIVDFGPGGTAAAPTANCQGAIGTGAFPVYYTIVATAAGSVTLPDTAGPNSPPAGKVGPSALYPTMSLCTAAQNSTVLGAASAGDAYSIQIIGLDYDMYGATFPVTKSAKPTIAGASGQSDITVSPTANVAAY